jgi:transposase
VIAGDELVKRWNVTVRTLERDRRAGLLAVRVIAADGTARLAYLKRSVEAFEKRGVRGAASRKTPARLTAAQRERIVREAAGYRRRLGWSLAKVSARLAERFGVSMQAVRQLLLRREARAKAPIFDEPGPMHGERRRELFEAWRGGGSPAALAREYGRSAASVQRLVNERRGELLRRIEWPGVPDDAGAFGIGLDVPILSHPAVVAGLDAGADDSSAGFIASAEDAGPEAELEHARALAYQVLRWQARSMVASLPRFSPRSSVLDEIETRLRWAALLKIELMRSVQGIAARAVAERSGVALESMRPAELSRWRRAAMDAAGWGVDHFDPFSGGRLAAPVSVALARSLAAVAHADEADIWARRTELAPGAMEEHWNRRIAPWQAWLDPPGRVVAAVASGAGTDAASALALRFGLGGLRPRTLAEVRRELGVSAQRFSAWMRSA